MVDVAVRKSEGLRGKVCAPPSKAYTHRALIASLLSSGTSRISNPLSSDDTEATFQAIKAFGAEVKTQDGYWTVDGVSSLNVPEKPVDCRESGATLRFMIPVATLAPGSSTFVLGPSLRRRPLAPLLRSLRKLGVECDAQRSREGSWVKVHGRGIKGGKTSMRGDISSQFVSGLLFACPKAEKTTEIEITTPLESRGYVQMTIEVLTKHGVEAFASNDLRRFRIPSDQEYKPYSHEVPGDFSSAAFLLAAAAITHSEVRVEKLGYDTTQGDKAILEILERMGSELEVCKDHIAVEGDQLSAIDIDARDIPDLVPVCAALACYAEGTSKLYNARRLRYKESNRLSSLHVELKKMGADIKATEDGLVVRGPCAMHGAVVNPHRDHRIAMACAVAALGASGETIIQDSECVKKSYPTFFEDLVSLGANVFGR